MRASSSCQVFGEVSHAGEGWWVSGGCGFGFRGVRVRYKVFRVWVRAIRRSTLLGCGVGFRETAKTRPATNAIDAECSLSVLEFASWGTGTLVGAKLSIALQEDLVVACPSRALPGSTK